MAPENSMMPLLKELWPIRRDLVSDGYDKALGIINREIPLKIHGFPTGSECWTWKIPQKWGLKEAFIEFNGKRIVDAKENPLHIASYSMPLDKELTREQLLPHLHSNPEKPDAIPYEYFFYGKNWAFCIKHNRLNDFKEGKYHVVIDSKFEDGTLKVGEHTIKGETDETILILGHLCHPYTANDGLSGVVAMVELAKRLSKRKNHYTFKFLIVPEIIGSIAYLSNNEAEIPKIKYGMFLEMLGKKDRHALQLSRQGNTAIDNIARYVLRKHGEFWEGPFADIVKNDEFVVNGPGVNVPCISLSRSQGWRDKWHYPEYHTHLDTTDIIDEKSFSESAQVAFEILEMLDKDFVPKRKFKDPVFLNRYGLWDEVDWRKDKSLYRKVQKLMFMLEGDKAVSEIAVELDIDFSWLHSYLEKFHEHGLIEKGAGKWALQ